jgi:hypothetical protein
MPDVAVGDRPFAPSLDGLERRLRSLDYDVGLVCSPRVLDLALFMLAMTGMPRWLAIASSRVWSDTHFSPLRRRRGECPWG